MLTIELKDAKEIRHLIQQGFPTYKKRTAFLSEFGAHGVNINSYWDGGSRDEYALVELATGARRTLPTATHPYFDIAGRGLANQQDDIVEIDRGGNIRLKVLPEGFALIRAGWFCGKPAIAHVFLNPANMTKLVEGRK